MNQWHKPSTKLIIQAMKSTRKPLLTLFWQGFCRLVVNIFYREFEVSGLENLNKNPQTKQPQTAGLILFANHVNALADPVIVQAATDKAIRPLARSGLFSKLWLKPWLSLTGAIPIYRPGDKGSDVSKNKDAFARCYQLLDQDAALIIFPEGQSHSDAHIHPLKSGAARLALGAIHANGIAPDVIPVGLNFSRKGRFRGDVLVNFGVSIDLKLDAELTPQQASREINQRMTKALKAVTLNADTWGDIDLVRRLEQFFALRQGKVKTRNLAQKFSAFQRLVDGQAYLREHEPEKMQAVIKSLQAYERLCQRFGIKDYHLTLKYDVSFIIKHSLRILFTLIFGLPILLFSLINSSLPYLLTRHLSKRMAQGLDQRDSSKIIIGSVLFSLFWGLQLWLVYHWQGFKWMFIYFIALMLSAMVSLKMRGQYGQIQEDIRVFFMLTRQQKLKQHILNKRRKLEKKLADLVRIVNAQIKK
ncbi:MAG: 1-acyl-sn-glycerol-3-phosphate acyltransferase [Arenicellales bacterium]